MARIKTRDDVEKMKEMSVLDFWQKGLLHEINRQFLHPMGLALEVTQDDQGHCHFSRVRDFRHDPEGYLFVDACLDPLKVRRVKRMFEAKRKVREAKYGWHVQPCPTERKKVCAHDKRNKKVAAVKKTSSSPYKRRQDLR